MTFLSWLFAGVAALLALPTAVFFLEIVAASMLPKRRIVAGGQRPRIAVLIPAHNEATGLRPTLEDVKAQLRDSDRLLVIADNCTDETASVAASSGAETTARTDQAKIGKGYALDWGLNYLAADAPDIIIIVDADCRLNPGAIDQLATVCAELQRPVQSLYLMTASAGSPVNHQVAEFAWRVKNLVRPMGLAALGLPCQLMGSGMAFPWDVIRLANLSTGHIVEDLKLGLELAVAGHAPIFCPSAVVTSIFPNSAEGTNTQRQRWEHGHIGLILTKGPVLLYHAIKRMDANLLALALDLQVPPLSLLGAMLVLTTVGAGLLTVVGLSSIAFVISALSLFSASAATAIAWRTHGRDLLPPRSFGMIASYFLTKLRQYGAAALGRRVSRWIRADRR
jgi:cellulose synthase/poly-beta-1,6-N-acetylglucosamine synthase-like glycosyltransferase